MNDVENEIRSFISARKESEQWDFKQEWHEKMEDLLKDIICFVNTIHNDECYIIFGVADDYKIVGMEKDRRKIADIVDAMSKLDFAEGIVPKISLETFKIDNKCIDVLIIYNVEQTPIYLKKDYGKMKAGCIYSRVGDRNTPNKGNSSHDIIEKLWRKRFGLLKSVKAYIIDSLKNKSDWQVGVDGYYYIYNPQYSIRIKEYSMSCSNIPLYAVVQDNYDIGISTYEILDNNVVLKSFEMATIDGGRLTIPTPRLSTIKNHTYRYYIKSDDKYKLLEFIYDEHDSNQAEAYNKMMDVIIVFDSEDEKRRFESFAKERVYDVFIENKHILNNLSEVPNVLRDKIREDFNSICILRNILEEFKNLQN